MRWGVTSRRKRRIRRRRRGDVNGGDGYGEKTIPVRYANGPLLNLPEQDKGQVLMRFPGTDKSVLSGLMRGVGETRNRPAIVEVPVESGRIILFATNPCYRWQNHGEFPMLFNSILHHNDLKQQ